MIYEDDGKGEGDIIVGRRPNQNEIEGFVPVSSGDTIRPDNHHKYHQRPSNFSVLISGIKKNIDVPSLARLFKEGKIAEDGEHEAFIGSPTINAPDGFHKINLPFMDPSQSSDDPSKLPSIFIAPLGYKAPKGYKGHPLPFDASPADANFNAVSEEKINLIHTTEASSEIDDIAELQNEVKTVKFKNPFLRTKPFLRNQRPSYKSKKTSSITEESIVPEVSNKLFITTEKSETGDASDSTNYVRSKIKFGRNRFKPQRKRVLTKIVRKPYTPKVTTPTPTLETKKIVRIVDPTSVSLKVEEYFPPTSGRPVVELGGRNEDKIDLVVDQDYNTSAVKSYTLGISTTFRPIQIKYLDLEPTKKPLSFYEPKITETIPETTSIEKETKIEDRVDIDDGDLKLVDHFEPTTTHNNLIFETTQSNEETTYQRKEFKNEEIDQENDETTITPTSFVTRNTFTPSITTYKPSTKIIQFLPYSPAATTKSTTTSTTTRPYRPTTTTKVVTDSNQSYEPTPFNFHLDPIERLERLNRLKNKKYSGKNTWSSNIEKEEETEFVVPTVRPKKNTRKNKKTAYKVTSNRIKYRKYGFNQGKDDGRIFGQRIKERKRPKLWDNGYVKDNYYSTTTEAIETTTDKKSKTEEYKRKFRPFFDQLYERLTNENDKDKETPSGNNRRISVFSVRRKIRPYNGWRKKSRSTTTPNPFTINAEIYEVHPESRARITTTTKADPPPTFETVTESSTIIGDYDNEVETEDEESDIAVNEVHETADKHTPVHHDYDTEGISLDEGDSQSSSSLLIPFKESYDPSSEESNEIFNNGLVDSNVALDFGESQFSENSFNEVRVEPPKSSVPPATRLLDQYQKTFKPSNKIANQHDSNYEEPKGIINEHSQQKLTVKEGDFIPFHSVRDGDNWEPRPLVPYVEIERIKPDEKEPLQISVETVPTKEVLQEVLNDVIKEGSKKESLHPNEIDYKPLPDYSNDYSDYESENEKTTVIPDNSSQESEEFTTISISSESLDEDVTTKSSETKESEETTASFFVTPTTQDLITDNDKILADPSPTIQENTLIIDESTQSQTENTSREETTSREDTTELIEEAVPEFTDEHKPEDGNDSTVDTTTVSETTVADNLEVTTFRPKRKGGFFENFNLANLLNFISPKTSTTTAVPITPTTTEETTEEESKAVTEITSTTLVDETEKHIDDVSTTIKELDEITDPTKLPLARLFEKTDKTTDITEKEYTKKYVEITRTEASIETTKAVSTDSPVDDTTTIQTTRRVPASTFETTYTQEIADTTTELEEETTQSNEDTETTEDTVEDDEVQTTEPNYISTTFSNRIRTERPFRGPFRSYKKGTSRYQRKNKNKLFSGLKKKLDSKKKKDSTVSKAVYGAIKREEYIKNWVARKYNKLDNNSKKRLFSLNTTFQPQTTNEPEEETTPEAPTTTSESQTSQPGETQSTSTNAKNAALPFAPTIVPPKNKYFNVDLDVTVRDGSTSSTVGKASSINTVTAAKNYISEKRKTFLDKLKSTARKSLSDKNNLFAKNTKNGNKSSESSSSSISSLPSQKSSKKISWVYPRGSNTNVFKTWGGNSLSQAEFERKVLGVSTATEVSVKSMICVRGRCYNADDKSLAKN